MTIEQAARELVTIWRNPDPEAWVHLDQAPVVQAIERLCEAVRNQQQPNDEAVG